jgi:hypothetical protein
MRGLNGGAFLVAAALCARAESATTAPYDGAPWASRQLFLGAISPSPPSMQIFSVTGRPGAEHPSGRYGTDCADCGPGQPLPPPAASAPCPMRDGTGICTTTCFFASDAECLDGGPGSELLMCAYGTDCGARNVSPPPPPHSFAMVYTNDCLNVGDSGGPGSKFATCAFGTDCVDCGPRVSMPLPPPRPPAAHPAPNPPPSICSTPCFYTSNADCDDGGFGCLICASGTDLTSCREHPPRRHKHRSCRHERALGRAVALTTRAVASTSCAVASTDRAVASTIRAVASTARAVASTARADAITTRTAVSTNRAVSSTIRAVSSTLRAVSSTIRAFMCNVRAAMGSVRAAMGNIRAVVSLSRAVVSIIRAVVSMCCAIMGTYRAVVSTSHGVGSTNRAIMTTDRAEHNPQRIIRMMTNRAEHFPRCHDRTRRRGHFTSPPPSMPPPKTPPCRTDTGLTPPPATSPIHPTSATHLTTPTHLITCSHTQRPDGHGETDQFPSGDILFDASDFLRSQVLAGRAHTLSSPSSSLGNWPTDVLHTQPAIIVCAGNVVAEVVDVMPFHAALVTASWDHLLAPDGAVAALGDHVILDAEEQMGDQRPTDAIIPGLWMIGQRLAPDLAHVLDVVRLVHVQPWQLVATLVDREGPEVDAEPLGAWRPLDSAFAAQDARCGGQRSTEGLLVRRFGELDKGCAMDLTKPLAHAAVVSDPGLVLREQSAPPLRSTVSAKSLHLLVHRAESDALLASEAEQEQVLQALHRDAIASSLKGFASRSVAPGCNLVALDNMLVVLDCLLATFQFLLVAPARFSVAPARFSVAPAHVLDHGSILNPWQLVLWGCMLMGSLIAWHHRFAKPLCTQHRREHGLHVALTLLALYSMLPCTKASDVPGLYSVQHVPSHRRELQTAVSTTNGLTSALANTAVGRIVLASGTYYLSAELSVTRSVILEAAVAGSVVLHAQASSSSQRRVLNINPGPTASCN